MAQRYVYLLRCDKGWTKIGASRNPESRLRSLGCVPMQVELLHVIRSEDAFALERHLHHRFVQYRVSGEWFNLPDEVLRELLAAESMEAPRAPCAEPVDSGRSVRVPIEDLLPAERLARVNSLLLSGEAALHLGVSPARVRQMCAAGEFPGAKKPGRDWHIPRLSLEAYERRPRGRQKGAPWRKEPFNA